MCLGSESLRSWNTPAPKVFISHLLCLAQMVDSAGLFVLFFYVKGYSEPHFFTIQTPLIVSAVPEEKRSHGEQQACQSVSSLHRAKEDINQ